MNIDNTCATVDEYNDLLAEVKRLQSYAADCKQHAKFATETATALERAAVVAWLRACEDESCVFADDIASQFAAEIERGDHRREETK